MKKVCAYRVIQNSWTHPHRFLNLSFGGVYPNHLSGHSSVQGKSLFDSREARQTQIQLALHQQLLLSMPYKIPLNLKSLINRLYRDTQ